jgi:hypothetical protein
MAEIIKTEVELEPARPAVTETQYTLTLNQDEVNILRYLVGKCPQASVEQAVGAPEGSIYAYGDKTALYNVLRKHATNTPH